MLDEQAQLNPAHYVDVIRFVEVEQLNGEDPSVLAVELEQRGLPDGEILWPQHLPSARGGGEGSLPRVQAVIGRAILLRPVRVVVMSRAPICAARSAVASL
ncbi:hypothetical protein [Streptomyces sp. AK04-3B]|uniref:hypothetical protein n=1 Tax=Streptomyces sp. AK04-3B TaxID=3028650 RepID=UPI0029A5E72B|nr:hypothetical protein [Streptomyces sp. AK04-3B]MDX3804021.1 hypothetical protein [Streptomyces sp. AK04-3B]